MNRQIESPPVLAAQTQPLFATPRLTLPAQTSIYIGEKPKSSTGTEACHSRAPSLPEQENAARGPITHPLLSSQAPFTARPLYQAPRRQASEGNLGDSGRERGKTQAGMLRVQF